MIYQAKNSPVDIDLFNRSAAGDVQLTSKEMGIKDEVAWNDEWPPFGHWQDRLDVRNEGRNLTRL